MAELSLQNLSKRYGDFQAVRDLTLTVPDGEFLVLLGPSGCGKTTTLRMIAGFVEPTSGQIILGGREVSRTPPWQRNAGLVFQSYALFPHMTVFQNVAFGLEMRRVATGEIKRKVEDSLKLVRLGHLDQRLPRQLSGGQQQRVALARALAFRPDVLLLDEPLSNLDAKLRHEVRVEIRELQRKLGITTVMVTHDQEEALIMADRLVVMNQGRVRQAGTQRDLYERPADRFVAGFVGRSTFFEGEITAPGQFRTRSGVVIQCPENSGAPGPATLALRPERILISPTPLTQVENNLLGGVEFVSYLGSSLEIHVRLAPGERVVAQLANRQEHSGPAIGDKLYVGWPVGAGIIFAGASDDAAS